MGEININKLEEIKQRFDNSGYTITRYGNRAAIREQMYSDIEDLLTIIESYNSSIRPLELTNKMNEAKSFVIRYTEEHGTPPSYGMLAKELNIVRSAAYSRMKYCRELMSISKVIN